MDTSHLLTARQVAERAGLSVAQVNRDAAGEQPKLPSAMRYPGKTGPRLFEPSTVTSVYQLEPVA